MIALPFQNTATSKKVLYSDEDDDDVDDDAKKNGGRVSEAGETVISSSDDDDGKVGEGRRRESGFPVVTVLTGRQPVPKLLPVPKSRSWYMGPLTIYLFFYWF